MAKAAERAAVRTTLRLGTVEAPVALFATQEKPEKLEKFDPAGPNGGVLKAVAVARPTPVDEVVDSPERPVHSDPLAADPGREAPVDPPAAVAAPATVDGQYGRELVEDGTGEIVALNEVRRGVRLEDGRFIDCTEQLAQIEEQTKLERMEIVSFVDITRIPRAWGVGAYYVGVDAPEAAKALRLIFEALKLTRRAAVVKLTKRTRQSLGVIGWYGKSLMFYELAWAEDFRAAPERATRIQSAEVSEREVEAACGLVNAMADTPDSLLSMRDDALALRQELRARALAGEVPQTVVPAKAEPESDLLQQLAQSLEGVVS